MHELLQRDGAMRDRLAVPHFLAAY